MKKEKTKWVSLLVLLFLGNILFACVGTSKKPKLNFWLSSTADLATTAYALEYCDNCREANPIISALVDPKDTFQVVITGLVLKSFIHWCISQINDKDIKDDLYSILSYEQYAISVYNLSKAF